MKKRLAVIFGSLFLTFNSTWLLAQEAQSSKTVSVYVTKLDVSKDRIIQYLNDNNAVIQRTDLSTDHFTCEFNISQSQLMKLDSVIGTCGYIRNNSFNTRNTGEEINILQNKLDGLQYEIDLYSKMLKDSAMFTSYKTNEFKQKIASNLQTIAQLEVSIYQLKQKVEEKKCNVNLTLYDEMSTPNNSRISFVNMPGVEYGFLSIENPKAGISLKSYQGATIKYMFTRGKSYINLGVYKGMGNNLSDTNVINELFVMNFGQDFYPRNFGRGKRRYFNLYTGYQIGGLIINRNNDKNSSFIPNANLSMGLELIKTKHILIDNKASYFLPLNEMNRNLRGILYQVSFNFVF